MRAPTAFLICTGLILSLPAGAQTIYRCETAGTTVFSDRPCAGSAELHELSEERVTVYTPSPFEAVAATRPATPKKRKATRSASDTEKQRARCERLETTLKTTRDKMRSGYGVKEGERLKARQKQLAEQRRQARCP